MTPQEWIKDTLNRWPAGHHVAEGATHLAAALEEIARLRADAGRVVAPELRGLTDEQAQAIADTFAIETTKYTVFRVWAIAQDQVACNGSVPAGRVLKDGEVAVREAEWQAANQFVTLQRKIDGGGDVDEEVEWHKGLIRAEKKLDALRTQATGEKDV